MRVVKFYAPVSNYATRQAKDAIRLIHMQLMTYPFIYFGGIEIVDIVNHDQPTSPDEGDDGFSVRLRTTDSNHYTFAFDDLIDYIIYPDPPNPDHISVTAQSYFGTYGTGYTKGRPNYGYVFNNAYNTAGEYTWDVSGVEMSILVYLDDNDNIVGLSNIRTENDYSENSLFIDYAKGMIYMTNGLMSSAGFGNENSWVAGIHSATPTGALKYYGAIGYDGKAFQTPLLTKDPFNNFTKIENSLGLTCFGMSDIYSGENHRERIEVDDQQYIHVGNRNIFFPYDTYDEIELSP